MSDITATLKYKFDNLKEHLKNSYSRSQIETILGELSSLQSEAASYGLNFDISNLKENAETKLKNYEVEQSIEKARVQEEEFLKLQRAIKLAEEEKEIAQRIAALNSYYNKEFIPKITKSIEKINEETTELKHTTNKLEKENVIAPDALNSHILTHEEILVQHKEHKELYEQQGKVNKEHESINAELGELNKEIENLNKELQKKNLTPTEIKDLKDELADYQEALKARKSRAEQLTKLKKTTDKEIAKYEVARKVRSDEIKKFGNAVKTRYEKDPEKFSEAYDKYKALKNQHKAIETDGIVKDTEHHNKVINKINADKTKSLADKMREQTKVKNNNVGSLSPSRTPNINSTNNKTRGI
ncbi:hypothetical protein H6P87_01209 [Rickettsia tillamookensis]|uniref:Uncharacterized protein n=1 Tax=Rickettsia tillamookensis TaxID=2761623 RepID=A0A9E6MIN5_9RICK|nr:hypothetical protein [Rickettsia tillamookensis]QQV75646.1 hypothetical protein H6P87_01209 [Rickettsia tillamookensis]